MHTIKSMGRRFEREHEKMTPMPEEEDSIFIKFDEKIVIPNGKRIIEKHLFELKIGDRILCKNIDLIVNGPQRVCIIGKNGVGKSTLLKSIAEELLIRKDIKAAYMPQDYTELLDFSITAIEFLSKTYYKDEQTLIKTYLGSMNFTADEMHHPISELSGGQKAKILLLKMSIDGNDVLLMDEPTRNFSPASNSVLRRIFVDYKGVIICVSHDRKFIREVCNVVYRLTEKGLVKEY